MEDRAMEDRAPVKLGTVIRYRKSGKLYRVDNVSTTGLDHAGYVHYSGLTDRRAHGAIYSFADLLKKFDINVEVR